MKTLDILNFKASGYVEIFKVVKGKENQLLGKYNTVLPNAVDILAHLMTDSSQGPIDLFRIENLGVPVATLNNLAKIFIAPGQAQYQGMFDFASFTGPFTDVFLAHSIWGDFSHLVISPALSKAGNEKILIIWTIQIL